jgi:hypothetical protein
MMSKQKIILCITLLISISSFTQQGINYKANLKDVNGNVLAGTFMNVQFTIHQSTAMGTIVYQEDHNYTTDANGLLILNIGTDTSPIIGVFSDIDWSIDQHFLQTSITYSGGTVNFDTTEFMAVPYAKHAQTAAIADNVFSGYYNDLTNQPTIITPTGLEQITELNPDTGFTRVGWRLVGTNPDYHGSIGNFAIDLSQAPTNESTRGATGNHSTAMGYNTYASSSSSVAMGENTNATAEYATALGKNSEASGSNSTSMGKYTKAESYAAMSIGSYNIGGVSNYGSFSWREEDPLFEIGNGRNEANRSNALTILKNGIITAPSLDLSEITDDKALITKEYFEANDSSELEAIDEGNGVGWRLKGVNATYYDNIGNKAVDLTNSSSLSNNGASGDYSFASGAISSAKGDYSTAMGLGTIALRISSVAIGKYNIENSSAIFSVGNGNAANARNTAMTVLDDGKVGIGRDTPTSLFEVAHQNGTPTSSNRTNAFSIRNLGTGRSWQFYTHPTGYLELYNDGSHRGSYNPSSGVYSTVSDRRLKKDITSLEDGTLEKVMQLNPVNYLMKDQTDTHRNLGLISQEVQELFPSLTHYVKESDLLTLSYTELIPILIKALQEQQRIIDGQNIKIEGLSADNSVLKAKDSVQDKSIETLVARLNLLESKSSH